MEYPAPQKGASLILSFRLYAKTTIVIGSGSVAAARAFAALEADSKVVVIADGGLDAACDELKWRSSRNQLQIFDWDALPTSSGTASGNQIQALQSYIARTPSVRFVCVTDTLLDSKRPPRTRTSAEEIYRVCQAAGVLVNTTDVPELCDFSFTSTHRFVNPKNGERTALQIGITSNGQGCRIAGRVKRDVVASLPRDIGVAVQMVGRMRKLAREADVSAEVASLDEDTVPSPNQPVAQHTSAETAAERTKRRMNWVAQISEYWPISRLANLSEREMLDVLASQLSSPMQQATDMNSPPSLHSLPLRPAKGTIFLVGSGPGHPSLLTVATHTALTRFANVVLSDKASILILTLVPSDVLALIPQHVEVRIARKFPGNADNAQTELMEAAVEAANAGKTVVRLKQGDPVVYGRAGEEILFFREHGFEPIVVPGVSSALAAPTFAGIPVTQRGVAESLVICTGVGRSGCEATLPGYERAKTVVLLMGVARLDRIVKALLEPSIRRLGASYPRNVPVAIVERASMPDQRVITSTLENIVRALDSNGEQRPPGLVVIGWAVLALWRHGNVDVLDAPADQLDEVDQARVQAWLDGQAWRVREGLDAGWQLFS
ncbi:uroporphyrin-III C-methyltransferase [Fistulina hepatica ATCC 64428]|nr:uroporphyrin-III C-methyltransferase [Fistulina hepatica ATCC 64428]